MSSSGVPLIDKKFAHSTSTAANTGAPPFFSLEDNISCFSADLGKATFISYGLSDARVVEMGLFNMSDSPQGPYHPQGLSGVQQQNGRAPDSDGRKGKGKEGKPRWFSQLKHWAAASEPSKTALKNYKKDTFNKAGIALDDPLANAKLHLPIASLPPYAIKPGGRGPEPEEIALKRAMQRKKKRDLMPVAGPSQDSQPSEGHCSAPSNVTVSAIKKSE